MRACKASSLNAQFDRPGRAFQPDDPESKACDAYFNDQMPRMISACLGRGGVAPCRSRDAGEPQSDSSTAGLYLSRSQKTVLENGLTVLSVPFDSPGIIAYYTVVRTGSRNEVEKGLSGFAHFFEHMMFRGTEAVSAGEVQRRAQVAGRRFQRVHHRRWTCYHMTIPATALATAVEIEADRFQNLKYDEPSFQKEARAVLGEYNKSASSPFLKLNETMQNTAYTTHTYKHTTIGFLDDIAGHAQPVCLQQGLFRPLVSARRIARSSWPAT